MADFVFLIIAKELCKCLRMFFLTDLKELMLHVWVRSPAFQLPRLWSERLSAATDFHIRPKLTHKRKKSKKVSKKFSLLRGGEPRLTSETSNHTPGGGQFYIWTSVYTLFFITNVVLAVQMLNMHGNWQPFQTVLSISNTELTNIIYTCRHVFLIFAW